MMSLHACLFVAGRFTPDRPYLVQGPIGIRQTSSSKYEAKQILPQGLGHGASPYGAGALNARPDEQR